MKRNSLALAVGAVLFGAAAGASAQSSVTIFGVMDAAIVRATGSVASTTRMNTSEGLGSRLGFRGVEDLGGGLKANFMAEAGLLNDTGAGAATNSNNQATGATGGGGLTFNRQIWVGMSGNFGEVRLGREYTPTFAAFALNDPFGANGSMVMSQAWQGAIGGLALANAVRTSNGVSYQSNAAWGPVRAHLMYALGENASNAGATANDGKTTGVRLTYNTAAVNVDLAHQRYTLASIGGMRETFLGATLPLGATKLYGQYMTESTGSSNSMKGYGLGVSYTMGVVDLKALYSRSALKSAAGANIGTTGRIALGAYYNLSKRTALFTQIVSVTNADGAANTVFPSYGAVTAANNGSRGYAVGIRHSF